MLHQHLLLHLLHALRGLAQDQGDTPPAHRNWHQRGALGSSYGGKRLLLPLLKPLRIQL